jgi:hypothetical protein
MSQRRLVITSKSLGIGPFRGFQVVTAGRGRLGGCCCRGSQVRSRHAEDSRNCPLRQRSGRDGLDAIVDEADHGLGIVGVVGQFLAHLDVIQQNGERRILADRTLAMIVQLGDLLGAAADSWP